MTSFTRSLLFLLILCLPTHAEALRRLKRAESYLGLHFDFHAGPDCTEIGKRTTPEMVEAIINSAHPDYIQIDCKGHPGFSSYPTKVGNPAPGFVGDPLRIWREVTAKHGVALYMHYSGVWDSEAIRRHPDWAVINGDGLTNQNATSFFGPYVDELLIPQLRELAGSYGVDGVWVDGDCWAAAPDYSAAALQAFEARTGFHDAPRKAGEAHWFEFLEFNRDAYRGYLRHYITKVKQAHPKMQLCSNWAFSDHMPEPICAPVDWISGDFSPEDSVNAARFSARYLAQQGKSWDLMAWGFTIHGETRNGSNLKSALQLEREAALVLSQGGGFESYYGQNRDGSVPERYLPVIGEVARFCRERQPFCQGAKSVPQIAFLYSTASHYHEMNGLFSRDLSRLSGTLQALLESQQTVDVVSEHHLVGRMSRYPLIIVGECDYLEQPFKAQLLEYARKGGRVLIMGPQAASLFYSELGVKLATAKPETRYFGTNASLMAVEAQALHTPYDAKVRSFGELHISKDVASDAQPAATIIPLGKGSLGATWFAFSREYLSSRSPVMRDFLADLVHELKPDPLVQVSGSSEVDVCVNRLRGKLAIHLINTSGRHWDTKNPLIDAIVPVGPLGLTIHADRKPTKIRFEPGAETLAFNYQRGIIHLKVPEVRVHRVVILE